MILLGQEDCAHRFGYLLVLSKAGLGIYATLMSAPDRFSTLEKRQHTNAPQLATIGSRYV